MILSNLNILKIMGEKKSYNVGNSNAKKEVTKESQIHLLVTAEEKNKWVKKASQSDDKKLSQWARNILNKACEE